MARVLRRPYYKKKPLNTGQLNLDLDTLDEWDAKSLGEAKLRLTTFLHEHYGNKGEI